MSNVGQAASAVVGGIVGFVASGFNPMGFMYGFQVGLLAGTALFPTQLPTLMGPRLEDLQTTNAQVGVPVVRSWGTIAVPGTVMWLGPIEEVATTEEIDGGLFGPDQSRTTYTYFQPIAVGLVGNRIAGILRIWENGRLVYDAREQQEGETLDEFVERSEASSRYQASFTLYTGAADQLPNPTIETVEGVGNVPAFRDLSYVVFNRRQLREDQALRHPQWRFEVYDGESDVDYIQPILLPDSIFNGFSANTILVDWQRDRYIVIDDAGDTQGFREFRISNNTELRQQTFENAMPGMPSLGGIWFHGALAIGALGHIYFPWFTSGDTVSIARINPDTLVMDVVRAAGGAENFWQEAVTIYVPNLLGGHPFGGRSTEGILSVSLLGTHFRVYDGETLIGTTIWSPGAGYTVGKVCRGRLTPDSTLRFYAYALALDPDTSSSQPLLLRRVSLRFNAFRNANQVEHGAIGQIEANEVDPTWTRFVDCRLFLFDEYDGTLLIGIQGGPSGFTSERLIKWDPETGTILWNIATSLPAYHHSMNGGRVQNNALSWHLLTFTRYLDTRDGSYIDIEWDEQVASFDGDSTFDGGGNRLITFEALLGPGGTRAPVVLEFGGPAAVDVSLARIVTDVCNECGLSDNDIDVTDLTTRYVHGYARTRPMSARACIEPLRMVGFFDCVESGAVLKWPTRGKPHVATIDAADLGAHEGEDAPPGVTTKKLSALELPRAIRVHYVSPSRDYEPGEQISPVRLTTDAVNDADIDLVAALDDDQAAQIAEIIWADAWRARWTHEISVDRYWAELEPADAILLPVDGRNERVRIATLTTSDLILRRAELVRDDDGAYESTAVAEPPLRQPNRLTTFASTELLMLDLPALREADDDAGFYAAAARSGIGSVWSGAGIYRSADGGGSWAHVGTVTNTATTGRINTALPAGITGTWDYANAIDVMLPAGTTLDSRTRPAVLLGANMAAIGTDGRWELVQFVNAEEISANRWRLTTLLRGRRGTEHLVGTSEVNDYFVLVSGPGIVRLPLSTAQIGMSLTYRAVTNGTSPGSSSSQVFTGAGMALETFSPVHVRGERDSTEDLTITWIRRDRLHQTMRSGVELPNSEADESYSIDILDGSSVVRTLTSSTPSVVYTAEDQTTDFGAPQSEVTVHIYQLSAIVGRGTPAEATI